ncbi:e3 ubiquitin-protein ligase RNF13 [Trichonephila clavipes]|nr:e3 ubiquitin-protein ligase RNF13 [Trichonephila clavipes]
MAPGSRCVNGKTCGCRISLKYRWAVMVPRINTRCNRVLWAMVPHTITPDVGAVCRYKANAKLRRSSRCLHTRTRLSSLLRLNLDSSLKTTWFHSAAVQFPRAWHHSKRRRRWVGVKSSTRNGCAIPNVLQPGAFVWFEKTQGPLIKVLPVPGWPRMKQLPLRMHFLLCGSLLDD